MLKYCPTCHRSNKEARFIGEFCVYCIADRISKNFPSKAKLVFCERCGRIRTRDGYQPNTDENLAGALSRELCNSKCTMKIEKRHEDSVDVLVAYPVDDDAVDFRKHIELKLQHQICQDDYRKSSGYYEAIVQIRGEKGKAERMAQKFIKFITVRGAFISKTEHIDNGIDLYVSNKDLTGKFFQFNKLTTKRSYTLYSIKQGKKVFRHTFLLKLDEI